MSNRTKTTLWHVALKDSKVVVSADPIPVPHNDYLRIRTITPRAAARKCIRDNLATRLYVQDDGGNEPDDLVTPNPHNAYQPRREAKAAKRVARRAKPEIVILK